MVHLVIHIQILLISKTLFFEGLSSDAVVQLTMQKEDMIHPFAGT